MRNHLCVFCGKLHDDTEVSCDGDTEFHYTPAGESVLFGQLLYEVGEDGDAEVKAVVSIHDDVSADHIALLMAAFMDRISRMEHVKDDPSGIMKALMGMGGT
jgi:hypothetical protein